MWFKYMPQSIVLPKLFGNSRSKAGDKSSFSISRQNIAISRSNTRCSDVKIALKKFAVQ